MHNSIVEFNYAEARLLADHYIHFNVPEVAPAPVGESLAGKTFVITGRLQLIQNREKLINIVESYGGKVSSNISSHTNYLINNDINSTSAKNKKAKELNIPIITEQDFFNLIGADNIERFK
jgi:DNA ligase (NAD+)